MMSIYLLTHTALIRKTLCTLLLCSCSNVLYAQQISPADAAASAHSFSGGKILKVKPTQGNKIDYRVKVLSPEGRVRNIIVDGDNGEVITQKKPQKRNKNLPSRQRLIKTGF